MCGTLKQEVDTKKEEEAAVFDKCCKVTAKYDISKHVDKNSLMPMRV